MEIVELDYGLIIWSSLSLIFLFAWILALIDIIKHEFRAPNDKVIWILLVSVMPFIGLILYYAIGRKNKIKINQL